MAQNTSAVFGKTPNIGGATATAANTNLDGTGTVYEVFAAHATEGSHLREIRIKPMGSIATATVVRLFLNNGGSTGTATNNHLVKEFLIAVKTQDQISVNEEQIWAFEEKNPNNYLPVKAGWKVYAATSQANAAGIHITAIGEDLA